MLECEKILIFGGTGSLGKTLIKRYVENNEVICFSRDESKHWTIKNEFKHGNLSFVVGDIRDQDRVRQALLNVNPTIVIIASALKHVDTCELSPNESIKTNVSGVSNVVDSIEDLHTRLVNLHTCLMVSTDKACAPTNVYGMCKGLAERIVLSKKAENIKFVATRYGNVLESRGSIVPLFLHQCKNSDYITVTHEDMTRFLMTLDDSVDLIENAVKNAKSGVTFIPDIKSMRIMDLAEIFAEKYDKKIKVIGMRPGEKLHEDLISPPEAQRAFLVDKIYHLQHVTFSQAIPESKRIEPYDSSKSLLSKEELKKYLESLDIFNEDRFVGKSINEVRQ